MPLTLYYQHTPLPTIHDVPVRVLCYYDILGMIIGSFPDRYRVYLKGIITRTSCSKIKGWENKFRGAYILQIQNIPVVTLSFTSLEFTQYYKSPKITLYLAP